MKDIVLLHQMWSEPLLHYTSSPSFIGTRTSEHENPSPQTFLSRAQLGLSQQNLIWPLKQKKKIRKGKPKNRLTMILPFEPKSWIWNPTRGAFYLLRSSPRSPSRISLGSPPSNSHQHQLRFLSWIKSRASNLVRTH